MNMYYSTNNVLTEHAALWAGVPAMVTVVTEFRGNITAIEDTMEAQVRDITGHAKDKALALELMVARTVRVCGMAMAYGEATGNQGLAEEMNVVASELRGYRDAIVAQRCQGLHATATANLAALAGYGVVAADLTDLQAAIDAYMVLVAMPRTKIVGRRVKTSDLGILIRDTGKLLDRRMDMLMRGFSVSQPEFFNQYTGGREIIDPASQSGAVAAA